MGLYKTKRPKYKKEVPRMAADKVTSSKEGGAPKSKWIDISYPLSDDMVHMTTLDPIAPHVDWLYQPSKQPDRPVTITMAQLNINVHHGTHIDAPRHFSPKGTPIDEMPLDAIIGPARVIESKATESVNKEELEPYNIQPGERILFKTSNSSLYKTGKYTDDFVYLSTEAAHFLVDKKISVVGWDYCGIVGPAKGNIIEVHETLLSNGIWIIETIDLSAVKAGWYEMICLPIRVKQGDAAPARAILRPL
jgi:arylformamidase